MNHNWWLTFDSVSWISTRSALSSSFFNSEYNRWPNLRHMLYCFVSKYNDISLASNAKYGLFMNSCRVYFKKTIVRSWIVSNKGPVLVWDNFFFLVLPIRYILYRDRLQDQLLIPYQEINRPIVERVLLLWPLIMNPNMAGPFWPIDPKIQHLLSFHWFKSLWWILDPSEFGFWNRACWKSFPISRILSSFRFTAWLTSSLLSSFAFYGLTYLFKYIICNIYRYT